jgi:predicted aspartyl protease
LDTGADLSAIPQAVADELELLPASTIIAEAYDGSQTSVETYTVTFEFANARFRQVEVILVPDAHALPGRDILNYFYAHLNGPGLTFNLRLSP